jgi:hypothetical protein
MLELFLNWSLDGGGLSVLPLEGADVPEPRIINMATI